MIRLVLLGDPVSHSRSPAIHRAAFAALGVPGAYEAHRCDAGALGEYAERIRAGDLDGANVTMPLKRDALRVADEASPTAARIGAANNLSRRDGRVVADNTDAGGITDAWERRDLPTDAPILLLGAGGAAAAALVALEDRSLTVSARRPDAAEALAARVGVDAEVVPWGTPVPGVVVSATPLGMNGEVLPAEVLEAAVALFDMAYGAVPTPAVAGSSDLPVADGIDMLVAQAVRSFEIWTGQTAPVDVMDAAARA
jgi:shikimate dehydrogenase